MECRSSRIVAPHRHDISQAQRQRTTASGAVNSAFGWAKRAARAFKFCGSPWQCGRASWAARGRCYFASERTRCDFAARDGQVDSADRDWSDGKLTIWRDGNQQQVQFTLQPAREMARQMASECIATGGIRALRNSADSDLASRTMRLEQQINSLTQELATLRQELAQLRTHGPVQTGFNAEANQSAPPQEPPARSNETPKPAPRLRLRQVRLRRRRGLGSRSRNQRSLRPTTAAPACSRPRLTKAVE